MELAGATSTAFSPLACRPPSLEKPAVANSIKRQLAVTGCFSDALAPPTSTLKLFARSGRRPQPLGEDTRFV